MAYEVIAASPSFEPASEGATYYEELGIFRGASPETIKRAFRERSQQLHPDHRGNHEAFLRLRNAYDTLLNTEARAAYDDLLQAAKVTSQINALSLPDNLAPGVHVVETEPTLRVRVR